LNVSRPKDPELVTTFTSEFFLRAHLKATSRKFFSAYGISSTLLTANNSRRRVAVDAPEPRTVSFPDGGKTRHSSWIEN
jgi:hypothetical protein